MHPIAILGIVFLLIAVRQAWRIRLSIWHVMLAGAVATLLAGNITTSDAIMAINMDVMLFLFGMFVVGQALEESGYLSHLSYRLFKRARSSNSLLLCILFVAGTASAILMNDTLAIIGTPVMLLLARKHNMDSRPLLLALAFGITIGSVMSPIGNPQNLLIALNGGIGNQFFTFLGHLFIPTAINLFIAYALIKMFYKGHFGNGSLSHSQEPIKDAKLAKLSRIALLIIFMMIIAKVLFVILGFEFDFRLTYIALAASLPVLLFSGKRINIIRNVDWGTLIFFASMFVLMQSVWDSGFFQRLIEGSGIKIDSLGMIFMVSIILSQFISNVPLVALYMPMLGHAGGATNEMMALAAGSTIAGNLSILGAASNVIIIHNAEKKAGQTITFFEFLRIGIPMTIINALVYTAFLSIF